MSVGGALGELTAGSRRSYAAAVVDLQSSRPVVTTSVNCDLGKRFEIGSVSKALTGLLVAQLIRAGTVGLGTTVGELLPWSSGTALGSVTVAELATHTSGLPRLGDPARSTVRAVAGLLAGLDPYGDPAVDTVLRSAARAPLRARGDHRYSNLGGAVLGQAVAGAASTPYGALLRELVLGPLEMTGTAVAVPGRCAAPGWSKGGRRQRPWLLGGYAPAGGVVSTIGDVASLVVGLLDGSAPGIGALDAVLDLDTVRPGRKSGLFWVIDTAADAAGPRTWHNGQTGGYSAFVGLRRDARTGVAVLADVADSTALAELARQLTRLTPG